MFQAAQVADVGLRDRGPLGVCEVLKGHAQLLAPVRGPVPFDPYHRRHVLGKHDKGSEQVRFRPAHTQWASDILQIERGLADKGKVKIASQIGRAVSRGW